MVNNYLKLGNRLHFFNDRNKLERINALGLAQMRRAVVYRRPDPMWDNVPAVGDGIGELDEIPEGEKGEAA